MSTTQERRDDAAGETQQAPPSAGSSSLSMFGEAQRSLGGGALQRKIQRRATGATTGVIQRKDDPNAAKADAPVGAPAAAPGLNGMLTASTNAKLDGKDVTLAAGTLVEIVSKVGADKLHVKVYSHHGGAQCDIPAANFKAQPAVAHKDFDPASGARQDDLSFRDMRGPLFGPSGKPEIGDVNQGYLGDCYLISAMGAVAAQSPDTIKGLFSPTTPDQASYTISLYQLSGVDPKGKKTYKRISYTIDSFIPVYAKGDGTPGATPHYAGQLNGDMSGQAAGNKPAPGTTKPLWPILLEKAYAIHRGGYAGGYADIGDQGGNSPAAMEALTGVASNPPAVVPGTDDGVIQKFKQYQTDHVAVTCGTLDHQSPAAATFTAAGDGSYSVRLHAQGDDATETSEIKKNTVRIHDKKGAVSDARDDGKTLVGADVDSTKSSVSYGDGGLKVTYKSGKKPAAPTDLEATADVRGVLNKDIRVHAWHAYMFERVDEKAKLIYFKNPWGVDHPKRGVTPAEFRQYFTGIDSNNIREKPATK